MIDAAEFSERVEEIASRRLIYRIGGVGKDGTCDCIGLIMGAMYELGHKGYDLHSTNYFARYQMMELKKASEKELFVGQLLYRARTNQDKLNARYLPGGRYYTGDLLDYYHVGVVTSAKPLKIIECTEYGNATGIVINTGFKNWHYGGRLRGVLYDGIGETAREENVAMGKATVVTKSGALNIREWPKDGPVIGEAPKGALVEMLDEQEAGWPRIRYGNVVGYASSAYLNMAGQEEKTPGQTENAGNAEVVVTIIDSAGNRFQPYGDWRVLSGSAD